mgnify:CR=1 FL=1
MREWCARRGSERLPESILPVGAAAPASRKLDIRSIDGGLLVQSVDEVDEPLDDFTVVTERAPSDTEWSSLLLAWQTVAATWSNAIVLANGNQSQKELVALLIQDHETMANLWQSVRSILSEVLQTPRDLPVFSHRDNALIDDFRNAYAKHISNEELCIYPASIQYMNKNDFVFMSEEMKVRRGVV